MGDIHGLLGPIGGHGHTGQEAPNDGTSVGWDGGGGGGGAVCLKRAFGNLLSSRSFPTWDGWVWSHMAPKRGPGAPAKGAAESKKARQAEPKGRGKSAAGAEAQQPNPKGVGKQSKGDPKGSGKSVEAEERPNPKGSGKQSQGKLKGSGKSAEERPNPKGSGKQSKGELKGSGKSAEERPNPNKGSGKQSKGGAEGIRQERCKSRGATQPQEGIR